MADSAITSAQNSPIKELDVLWVTAGLGCDGDTIAVKDEVKLSFDIVARKQE